MGTDIETQIKNFNKNLQKLNESITIMRKFGLNEDILLAYLCHNLKKGVAEVKEIMNCYESFYEKMLKNLVLESLENEQKD